MFTKIDLEKLTPSPPSSLPAFDGSVVIRVDKNGQVVLSDEDVDRIADRVVQRLRTARE